MLFRMREGMSGYPGDDDRDRAGLQLPGVRLPGGSASTGGTHVAGASSEERRTRLFSTCKFQPVKGDRPRYLEADPLDVTRAALDAFASAAQGGPALPDPLEEMIHGAAVTEAVVRSAASGDSEPGGALSDPQKAVRSSHESRQRSRTPDLLDARASG